jgi:hypothetical protein
MRGLRRALWAALLGAALLPAGSSGAARIRTVKLSELTATGSLTYTWTGDPARGCAAAGVCGIHGVLILRPQSPPQALSPGGGSVVLPLDGSSVARVVREQAGAVLGECTDLPENSFGTLYFNLLRRRATTATVQPPPTGGRCAGPAGADLAKVSVPVRRAGRASFDLTGTRSFVAGPFSGTLVSTIRLTPGPSPSQGQGFSSSSSGPGHPVQPASAPITEFVSLQYRVSAASDAILARFSGAGQPGCRILDACGGSGSIALTVAPSTRLTVIGSRMVHRRLTSRQVLGDVRRGRLSLNAFQLLTGSVAEVFEWPDGSSCRDTVAAPSLLLNTGSLPAPPAAGRTIPVTISANGGGPDVFRTHCPGPDDADLFGPSVDQGSEGLARGAVSTAQLLSRRSVLALSDAGSFSGLGYTGSRTGSIVLDLTLTKVTAETGR